MTNGDREGQISNCFLRQIVFFFLAYHLIPHFILEMLEKDFQKS